MKSTSKKPRVIPATEEEMIAAFKPKTEIHDFWTLVSAFNHIVVMSKRSSLLDKFFDDNKFTLDYLSGKLGFSHMACVFLAVLIENEESFSYKEFADHFGCTRLTVMTHRDALDELISARWVHKHFDDDQDTFVLAYGVVDAVSKNQVFLPENLHCDNITELATRLADGFDRFHRGYCGLNYTNFCDWLMPVLRENQHLRLASTALSYDFEPTAVLLCYVVGDYVHYGGSEGEGLLSEHIRDSFSDKPEFEGIRRMLHGHPHPLMHDGWIEYSCTDGIEDHSRILLTRKAKEYLLENYLSPCLSGRGNNHNCIPLRKASDIKPKTLFFNPQDDKQVKEISSLLNDSNFAAVQHRLSERGLRSGFACLFYGAPGTGKTETVLQLARLTGRDIFQVDISAIRDKWVGESEKNIKAAFTRYRSACASSERKPILFFNEADAIFSRRFENVNRAVDQMENTMQNIVLQEIEDLDGILIATTNLTGNLDPAFERRFLFKLEFHKPDLDSKTRIWTSLMPSLSKANARKLASEFDFSGGQIENISRKCLVDYVLKGTEPDLSRLRELCREEKINGTSNHRAIGF